VSGHGASPRIGLLLMAHGTPQRRQELASFYTEIRRGSPPPAPLLDELAARYDAIGGLSPLAQRTEAQRRGVAAALEQRFPGVYLVVLGNKFATPRIVEAVDVLVEHGCRRAVGVVLAPHASDVSVGDYRRRALASAGERIQLDVVDRWHLHPGLISLFAARVEHSLRELPADCFGRTVVIFTAHSVPQRVVEAGDDYPAQVRATAEAVAEAAGVVDRSVAFQSAGRTPDPWVGPDLLAEIGRYASEGRRAVVVCPVGFVSDHLEILYDLDIEARAAAERLDMAFARTASLNDDPAFCAVVADVACRAAGRE